MAMREGKVRGVLEEGSTTKKDLGRRFISEEGVLRGRAALLYMEGRGGRGGLHNRSESRTTEKVATTKK